MFTLHEDIGAFMLVSLRIVLRMRNVSCKICIENQNTHFMLENFFIRKSCRLCENGKNVVYTQTPQTTV